MTKRIEWIGPLKGIGILAVVIGHIYFGNTKEMLFVFHMPLFFFLGGFLLKPRKNYLENLKHKALTLLIPYASFLTVIYGFQAIQSLIITPNFSVDNLTELVTRPLLGGHLFSGMTSAFWFTGCFFWTQQLSNFLASKLAPRKLWLPIAVLLGASYVNYLVFPTFHLPWSLNIILGATPIYLLGFLFSQISSRKRYYLAALPVCIVTMFYVFGDRVLSAPYGPLNYDMKDGIYGIPGVSLIAALGVVVALMWLSEKIVELSPWLATGLTYVGNASMVIMYVHVSFLILLRERIGSADRLTVLVLAGSLATYALLNRSLWGRAFFLGSRSELSVITKQWPSLGKLLRLT